MKRFLMLVGVAVVAGAMYVAASPASQQAKGPTAKQFNALKKQVAGLSKSLKSTKAAATTALKVLGDCVQASVPIDEFGDPTGTQSGTPEGYDYGKGTWPGTLGTTTGFFTTALDVSSSTDTGALWVVGTSTGTGSTACTQDLSGGGLRHAAARAGVRLPHALSSHFSLAPHHR